MKSSSIGFMHIPKTGGTSLGTALENLFIPRLGHLEGRTYNFHLNPQWRQSPTPIMFEESFLRHSEYDMYKGHIHYHPLPRIRWLSMVRHPVSHFVSWFYSWFKLMRASDKYPEKIRKLFDCTLEEYLDAFEPEWSLEPQPQTHFELTWSKRPLSQLHYFSRDNNVEEALERVRSEKIVTGLFERYQESIVLFNEALSLALPVNPMKMNVGSYPSQSSEIQERIAELIPLEMKFYHGVKELFTDSLQRYGISMVRLKNAEKQQRASKEVPLIYLERQTRYLCISNYKSISCFGDGEAFRSFIENHKDDYSIKLFGGNEKTWGQSIEGYPIRPPHQLPAQPQSLLLLLPPIDPQILSRLAKISEVDVALIDDDKLSVVSPLQKKSNRDLLRIWYLEGVRRQTTKKKLVLWGSGFRAHLLASAVNEDPHLEIYDVIDNQMKPFNGRAVKSFQNIKLNPKIHALVLCMNPIHYLKVEKEIREVSKDFDIIRLHFTRG